MQLCILYDIATVYWDTVTTEDKKTSKSIEVTVIELLNPVSYY